MHVAYRGDKLVGALPLCVRAESRSRRPHVPRRGAGLARRHASGKRCGRGIAAQLAERAAATEHDFADFLGLPASSPFASALGPSRLQADRSRGSSRSRPGRPRLGDVLQDRLSSNQRALRRRRTRQLAKLGTLETTIARTREELATALEDAYELHARRWQGRPDGSDFGTTIGKDFQREGTAALAELDIPRIVTLKLDGRPIAFSYYFMLERTMFCHRLAFDPELGRLSPGLVNRYDALENAFSEGVTRVEFFGGTERYKMELTDTTQPLHEGLGLAENLGGQGGRGLTRERNPSSQVPETLPGPSPLLLRRARTHAPAVPHRQQVMSSTAFYLAKAGGTRARSAAWLMRTRGRLDTAGSGSSSTTGSPTTATSWP